MRIWLYLLRTWVDHAAGSVVCWWKNDHEVIYETGVLAWRFAEDSYWERTYCIRCGVTLREEMS
jgi:hypothetical protein